MTKTQVTWVIDSTEGQPTLKVQRARLSVVQGPDKGSKVDLESHGAVVGTSPECALVLSDQAVSRRHFELRPVEAGYHLRDLGSTNGTFVKDLRVEGIILTGQETIKAGESHIRFSLLNEHDAYPLSSDNSFGDILGNSVAMRRVFAVLERAASSDSILLLEGESGTGKDLAAETVHRYSKRREQPFMVVDCGTIQSSLMESELFGHAKGAFTGAERDRAGVFESANQGTVFLDEIGELNSAFQPKLLRLLENREVKRLGENSYRPVDMRLIAATNRDLSADVAAGKFREDLYYRLSVLRVRMPPLRERLEDLAPLARSFVSKLTPDKDPREVISDQVMGMFMNHDWPGNVRELRNVVERLLLFPEHPESAILQDANAPGEVNWDVSSHSFQEARERFDRAYLSALLNSTGGVVAKAAKIAGVHRQTFYRLMSKYNLTK